MCGVPNKGVEYRFILPNNPSGCNTAVTKVKNDEGFVKVLQNIYKRKNRMRATVCKQGIEMLLIEREF